jgi:hypothetical protein
LAENPETLNQPERVTLRALRPKIASNHGVYEARQGFRRPPKGQSSVKYSAAVARGDRA